MPPANRPFRSLSISLLVSIVLTSAACAQTPSLNWWSFPGGGLVQQSTGLYRLSGAIGIPASAPVSGGVFSIRGGAWSYPSGGVLSAPDALPSVLELSSPEPNPSLRVATITFALPEKGPVCAEVFDVRGVRVARLVDGIREAGRYREMWNLQGANGDVIPAGIYFVRLRTRSGTRTTRLVHLD